MIRRAVIADIPDILTLLAEMHKGAPIPLPPMSILKTGNAIEAAINGDVVFVSDPIDGILALRKCTYWYSNHHFLADLVFFVRPSARKSQGAALLRAAQHYAKIENLPLLMAVSYGEDVARKDSFFTRKGMTRIGGVYQRGP